MPNEVLLHINSHLHFNRNDNFLFSGEQSAQASLARVNRRLHSIINRELYRDNVRYYDSEAAMWAVFHGNLRTLEMVAAHDTSITERCLTSRHLHDLIGTRRGWVDVAWGIQEIEFSEDMECPLLHVAVIRGQTDMVIWLLNHGANMHTTSRSICTVTQRQAFDEALMLPVLHAIDRGYVSNFWCYFFPCGHVSGVLTKTGSRDILLLFPILLKLAYTDTKTSKVQIVDILMARGHSLEAWSFIGEQLNEDGDFLREHETVLTAACAFGQFAIVDLLLKRDDADANEADMDGNTLLHHLAFAPPEHGQLIATRLIAAGAILDARNNHGLTPLQLACRYHNYGIALSLIDQGASLEFELDFHHTPLTWCCMEPTEVELSMAARLRWRDADTKAWANFRNKFLQRVIGLGMDVNKKVEYLINDDNAFGWLETPLSFQSSIVGVAWRDRETSDVPMELRADSPVDTTVMEILLAGGADVEATAELAPVGTRGMPPEARPLTPMHAARKTFDYDRNLGQDKVRVLLEHGANIAAVIPSTVREADATAVDFILFLLRTMTDKNISQHTVARFATGWYLTGDKELFQPSLRYLRHPLTEASSRYVRFLLDECISCDDPSPIAILCETDVFRFVEKNIAKTVRTKPRIRKLFETNGYMLTLTAPPQSV